MPAILVIHGPNLNLLGEREPQWYGRTSLEEVNKLIRDKAARIGCSVEIKQSNHEGAIVDMVQEARGGFQGILINPAAFTHTSIAIRDALAATGIPAVEVHLSNVFQREEFRRVSLTAPVCIGSLCGFGPYGYLLGLEALVHALQQKGPAQ